MKIITPKIPPADQCSTVYDPAEDSFLMLDVLEDQLEQIETVPTICLEIGSGSGILITALAKTLGSTQCAYFATDINQEACESTKLTAQWNGNLPIHVIRGDSLAGLKLTRKVDILLCNPPYVATSEAESKSKNDISAAAWAGGPLGRNLTDRVIRLCSEILSPKVGVAFLVLEQCNRPTSVMEFAEKDCGLRADIVGERRAGRERLFILKISNI